LHTRRFASLFIALTLAVLLQSTFGRNITIFSARPDPVLLLVVSFSVARGMEEGVIAGIVGGLLLDTLSAIPFGVATITMGIIGFTTGIGEANVYRTNFVICLVAVFLATVFYHSIVMLSLQAIGWNVEWISTLALQTIPGAVFNAALAPLVFPLVRRLGSAGEEQEQIRW
jgi:rod shape-determining protein MreD